MIFHNIRCCSDIQFCPPMYVENAFSTYFAEKNRRAWITTYTGSHRANNNEDENFSTIFQRKEKLTTTCLCTASFTQSNRVKKNVFLLAKHRYFRLNEHDLHQDEVGKTCCSQDGKLLVIVTHRYCGKAVRVSSLQLVGLDSIPLSSHNKRL